MLLNKPIEILECRVEDIKKEIEERVYLLHNFEELPNKFKDDLERKIMLLNMDKVQILEAIEILERS